MLRTLAVAALAAAAHAVSLEAVVKNDGAYSIVVDGASWFESDAAAYAIRSDNDVLTTANGGLKLDSMQSINGVDQLGPYTGYELTFSNSLFVARFKEIQLESANAAIIFEQSFPLGVSGTQAGGDAGNDLATAFPLFAPPSDIKGYITWYECMSGGHVGQWNNNTGPQHFGNRGGPVAIYNATGATVVISSANDFMVSGTAFPSFTEDRAFGAGFFARLDGIPAGWTHRVLMVAGAGQNATMQAWGDALLVLGGKQRTGLLDDKVTSFLSYWTDNGAYYYYNTEGNKTYEQTILDVESYAQASQIPYQVMMYDSWWYFKLPNHGAVTLWEPMPEVFPDGMTQWQPLPLALHNRYFAPENNYTAMGYDFIVEPGAPMALPIDQRMFEYIMGKAAKWGMILYEQDWLNYVYESMNVTQTNITASRTWMMAMANAATTVNVTMQLCMPLPIHMLQSTEMQPVTNARASGDYHPGQHNWQIGLSSLFYHAIGVQPSKDDFWTTTVQPGNPYSDNPSEPNVVLETIVATLSTGPVGPSDAVGMSNASLIMRTCRAGDGLLLRPDVPAVIMDASLATVIATNDGNVPYVTTSYTAQRAYRWYYVLAADLSAPFSFSMEQLGPNAGDVGSYAVVDWFSRSVVTTVQNGAQGTFEIPTGQGLPDAPAKAEEIRYYTFAPVFANGWSLLGEQEKVVPMSRMRTPTITITSSGFSAAVSASTAETQVTYLVRNPTGQVSSVACNVAGKGAATLSCGASGCSCN